MRGSRLSGGVGEVGESDECDEERIGVTERGRGRGRKRDEGSRGDRGCGGGRERAPARARRNEIFERRRTDVGRCFYERPAVCVDVNYIGGHEEQIAARARTRGPWHTYRHTRGKERQGGRRGGVRSSP